MTILALTTLALRISVIIVAAGIVNALRTRASAGSRHWLWILALTGTVIVPLAPYLTPGLPVLPWTASVSSPSPIEQEKVNRDNALPAIATSSLLNEEPLVSSPLTDTSTSL